MDNPLLRLIQLSDSAFPIGAYSHSFGFEALIERDAIRNFDDARSAIEGVLQVSIAPQDGVACALAYESDEAGLLRLDEILSAMKWPREIQEASLQLGERLKRIALELGWCDAFPAVSHHAVVFGYLCKRLDLSRADAVSTFLFTSVTTLASACVRLVPLGHTDGQRIISESAEVVARLTQSCLAADESDIAAFAPVHEHACVEHEQLYARIFQS
jgi:urease accessory protein